MIRARTRMFGSRTVVLVTGPTHPALAGLPSVRSGRVPPLVGDPEFGELLGDLARRAAAQLLSPLPAPFGRLSD